MPVLEYYHRLFSASTPELVHVAAPFNLLNQRNVLYEVIRHRLEDQCHTRVLLYEREFPACITRTVSRGCQR